MQPAITIYRTSSRPVVRTDKIPAAVFYPLADSTTLKLSNDSHDLHGKFTVGGGRVQPLLGGYKLDTQLLQTMEMVQQEPEIAEEPVQLAHGDDAKPALARVNEEPLKRRSLIGTAAVPAADILVNNLPVLALGISL